MNKNKYLWLIFIIIYFAVSIFYSVSIIMNLDLNNIKVSISNVQKFPFYNQAIKLNNHMRSNSNSKVSIKINNNIVDQYYKLNDGSIVSYSANSWLEYEKIADQVVSFGKYLENNKVDFLYIENPVKEYFYQKELKKYGYTYNYRKESIVLKEIKDNKINHIYGNEILNRSGIKRNDLFYNTDYHWNVDGALYFAKAITDYLNFNFKYNFDSSLLERKNFREMKFPNSFYGYYGRNMGLGYEEYDDFKIYVPNYNTYYDVYYGKDDYTVSGDFLNTLYYLNYIENIDEHEYQAYMYQLGGLQPIVKIKNNYINNNKKILFIVDSMFYQIGPYLSLVIPNMDIIDLRKDNGNYNGNLKKYIDEENIDCVVYMADISSEQDLNKLK